MVALRDLMALGYFPKELPPPFTSVRFGDVIVANQTSLPREFTDAKRVNKLCTHSLSRPGNVRRQLGIPNPASHYNVCRLISSNWRAIEGLLGRSGLTQSSPVVTPGGPRALVPRLVDGGMEEVRARQRCVASHLLKADIASFYHTIYTHSIPWAIDTKTVAKRQRSGGLGNDLDLWTRNGQDGQTVGIPIGPDTSLVIAELVLSAADGDLAARVPGLRGCRYFDDYELSFLSRGEADAALAALQQALGAYELRLNSSKTRIEELPVGTEKPWINEVRSFEFREGQNRQRTDIIHYFDRVFELSMLHRDDSVAEYAIGRLEEEFDDENWQLVQSFLLQTLMGIPNASRECLRQLLRFRGAGREIDTTLLGRTLNAVISRHAPLGHASETAWATWAAIVFEVRIEEPAAKALCTIDDSVCALLALDANSRELIQNGFETTLWETSGDADGVRGEQWLLAYEANVRGWLPSAGGTDYVGADPCLGFLKSQGVRFYDPPTAQASATDIPRSRSSFPGYL